MVIFVGLRRNSAPFFSSQQHQCVYDAILSDTYRDSINSVVTELLTNNFSAYAIIHELQQKFPIVKKIIISYQPAAIRVMVSAHEPVCTINNECALTAQKEIFPIDIFSEKAITNIANIAVMPDSVNNMAYFISHLLDILPAHVFQAYNVELVNEHYVRLADKKQPKFTIVSSVVQEKLSFLLSQCDSVKHTIAERKDFEKGTKWIADTRFAHYIVAYKA